MGLLGIGKKDKYGRQVRIEHRGRFLRASRTGGVALRAQTRAMGVNLTANTSHGFRVSATPVKNTQVALQQGRFVLRGRYSKGPLNLNLSKTGITFSTSNRLGTFNWVKPGRSSVKIFGIQFRGHKASHMQVAYMAVSALLWVLGLFIYAAALAVWAAAVAAVTGYRLVRGLPAFAGMKLRHRRNKEISRLKQRLDTEKGQNLKEWSAEKLVAAVVLISAAWGRGESAAEGAVWIGPAMHELHSASPLHRSRQVLEQTAMELDRIRDFNAGEKDFVLAMLAMTGEFLAGRLPDRELSELLLDIDELILQQGRRTVLQERMLEVFADYAGLRFVEHEYAREDPHRDVQTGHADEKEFQWTGQDRDELININRASLEELMTLPHIGRERAEEIIRRRPWASADQLQEISGIGPARLEKILRKISV